jgi:hypothetical protein
MVRSGAGCLSGKGKSDRNQHDGSDSLRATGVAEKISARFILDI